MTTSPRPTPPPEGRLDHDIVIVTRNRPEALRMSIPLLLRQTRLASRLIIVDSSDDHGAVRKAVEAVSRDAPFPIEVIHSEKGMTRQRAIGLDRVRSPVVLYPDDDSLFYPDASEAIVRMYERDTEGIVGGVCGLGVGQPPSKRDKSSEETASEPAISAWDRFKTRMGSRWPKLINSIAPDPFKVHGRVEVERTRFPAWLREANGVPVEWMGGFRMSFRTSVIREVGFEENFREYCLFEDTAVSFGIFAHGKAVIATHDARIFHHRFPSKRSGGLSMGVWQILNRTFIICRYSAPGSDARRALHPFAALKLAQYLAVAHTRYGRDLVRGVWRAKGMIDLLDRSSPDELVQNYYTAQERCLAKP